MQLDLEQVYVCELGVAGEKQVKNMGIGARLAGFISRIYHC